MAKAPMTVEELTQRAEPIYRGRYTYEGFTGEGPTRKALVRCKEHGVFSVRMSSHLNKNSGCPVCGQLLATKLRTDTLESFSKKASAKFPDSGYVYTHLSDSNPRNISFICPNHGEVVQTTTTHLKRGCSLCLAPSTRRRYTLEHFLPKAHLKHENKYTYISISDPPGLSMVTYICKVHGEVKQGLSIHLQGYGCPSCGYERLGDSNRYTLETFTKKASKIHAGKYKYLEVYADTVSGSTFVKYECPKHGHQESSTASHLNSLGCNACARETQGKPRTTLEDYIEKARAVHGDTYTYDDLDFTGDRSYIKYSCKTHGSITQAAYSHLNGKGCKGCWDDSRGLYTRYSFEDYIVQASGIHSDEYIYVSLDYSEDRSRVNYICKEHGLVSQSASTHLMGTGCGACGTEKRGVASRKSLEDRIEKAREKHGDKYEYLYLSYPEDAKATLTYICPTHGEYTQTAADHLRGKGCGSCTTKVSSQNLALADFVTSLGLEVKLEHRFPNSRKFIDLVIPEHKLAIEYNGNYWHSSEYLTASYHKEKTKLANENGYRMLHIWSHEWRDSREKIESIIRAATGKHTSKVFARKTEVYIPTIQEAKDFMTANHIQGATSSGTYVALKYQDALVAVMCFSHNTSSRGQKADSSHAELTRYSTNTSVVGGFTKLLNYYLKENPQVQTVVSYSDNRMFTGTVYEKAGFAKIHTTGPNYSYLERGDSPPRHKANYQKSKLIKRFGEEACRGKTERQITEENNIYRIYDCGLTKWLYTRV